MNNRSAHTAARPALSGSSASAPAGASDHVPFNPERLRVLVFEDSARDAALIRKFLETAGVRAPHIHHADTIPSALQILARESVDLCLADYYLQPHTGLDLMDEARRSDFDLPFVVMTALDDRAIDQHALARGAYGFLVKGELTVERLERQIRYALVSHRRESALGVAGQRDALTGLGCRASFMDALTSAVADRASKKAMVGLALFDLEGLGEINDRAGFDGGDEALRVIANRLRRTRLPGETAARLDGAEFALLMTDFVLAPHALVRAREVAGALGAPVVLGSGASGSGPAAVAFATGVAAQAVTSADTPKDMAQRLLQRATQALREAKRSHREPRIAFAHIH